MRTTTGLIVAAAFLLSLTACAAAPGAIETTSGSCAPIWQRGGLATDVTASGDVDAVPLAASFPTPIVSAAQSSTAVLSAGTGAVVQPDAVVDGSLTIFDGSTGEVMTSGKTVLSLTDPTNPLINAAACATVGPSVVAIGPASDLIGASYVQRWGVDASMTIVSVLDIDGAYLGRATGAPVPPQPGLPTVSRDSTGRPGLSFTGAQPPSDLRIETLIQGDGATVQSGDYVLAHYTGVNWTTKQVFDSTWANGGPASFTTDQVVPGFQKAIVGAKVGSEVLASVPPSDGYGDSSSSPVGATDTMVFVIDILGILPASEAPQSE